MWYLWRVIECYFTETGFVAYKTSIYSRSEIFIFIFIII